jgi:hypothetical protein
MILLNRLQAVPLPDPTTTPAGYVPPPSPTVTAFATAVPTKTPVFPTAVPTWTPVPNVTPEPLVLATSDPVAGNMPELYLFWIALALVFAVGVLLIWSWQETR